MKKPPLELALALATCIAVCLIPNLSHSSAPAEVVMGPDFQPLMEDPTCRLEFRPPPQHVEAPELAKRRGLFKAYQLPAPDGRSRSTFTVAFQGKSAMPGLRNLKEFVDVDLYEFKKAFPDGVVAQINLQGSIPAKFAALGFPVEAFMFKGNMAGSSQGDSLALFFATTGGYWSVVWSVPQQVIERGFPVFFESFIEGMTTAPQKGPTK